jgi:hypothetical protein
LPVLAEASACLQGSASTLSDDEIVSIYLMNKVCNRDKDFTSTAIAEINLNKTEPWDLPHT